MGIDADSLLRIVPDQIQTGEVTGQETLELHLERYRFAARHARPGRLLDIACGVGYGTRLVADLCAGRIEAVGVDLSEKAVAYAVARYGGPGVSFQVADAADFHNLEGFDTIISLETIEHLPDPVKFVDQMMAMLKPGGVLVASAPVTPSVDINPHHLHDFTESSLRRLLARQGLLELAAMRQVQFVRLSSAIRKSERRMKDIRPNLPAYYAHHPRALLKRIWSTVRYGPTNRYLTIASRLSE